MRILGIETSCDETGVALFDETQGLLGNIIYSQTAIHQAYGGVVPELASRDHIVKLLPLLKKLLHQCKMTLSDIDAIAYTAGPGLIGALLVGACFARSIAFALNIPAIAVHHMEGHLLAPMLEKHKPSFPFLALLVSGGHTMLLQVNAIGDYSILGQTLDDAVGEAFDKVAKLLGLPYPGGPALAALAKTGNEKKYHLPRPMTDRPGLDFSFSGLKTAVMHLYQAEAKNEQTKADLASAFQAAAIDPLIIKCKRASKQTGISRIVIAGGVSANQKLRDDLSQLAKQDELDFFFPRHEFCTDNAAMIAYAGLKRLQMGIKQDLSIEVKARWPLPDINIHGNTKS